MSDDGYEYPSGEFDSDEGIMDSFRRIPARLKIRLLASFVLCVIGVVLLVVGAVDSTDSLMIAGGVMAGVGALWFALVYRHGRRNSSFGFEEIIDSKDHNKIRSNWESIKKELLLQQRLNQDVRNALQSNREGHFSSKNDQPVVYCIIGDYRLSIRLIQEGANINQYQGIAQQLANEEIGLPVHGEYSIEIADVGIFLVTITTNYHYQLTDNLSNGLYCDTIAKQLKFIFSKYQHYEYGKLYLRNFVVWFSNAPTKLHIYLTDVVKNKTDNVLDELLHELAGYHSYQCINDELKRMIREFLPEDDPRRNPSGTT